MAKVLPPHPPLEKQLRQSLQYVINQSVSLSVEMRTQRAEYIMLPPFQPDWDTNGDLTRKVYFNASLMSERSGVTTSGEELESQQAAVRLVLFPLVVKKGDDAGIGEDETVVYPGQMLAA